MKNHNPAGGRRLHIATAGQRAFTLFLMLFFFLLIWAAHSGRYDREVNRAAAWLEQRYDAVVQFTRETFRQR